MNLTCAHHRLSRLNPHVPPRLQPRPAREAPLQEEHARRATRMPRSHGKREHGQQQAGAADHRAVESAFKGRTIASTNRAWLQMARIEHKHAQRAQRIGAVRCVSIRNRSRPTAADGPLRHSLRKESTLAAAAARRFLGPWRPHHRCTTAQAVVRKQ